MFMSMTSRDPNKYVHSDPPSSHAPLWSIESVRRSPGPLEFRKNPKRNGMLEYMLPGGANPTMVFACVHAMQHE